MQAMVGTGPFHEGELALQRATGEWPAGQANGRIIADRIVPNAVGFVARQQLAIVATIDDDGRPWASALVGPVESFRVLGDTRLALERAAGHPDDPMWANLRRDSRIGVLFIEPASRRRYRINGRVAEPDADGLIVDVAEALPNCPKYITRRTLQLGPSTGDRPAAGGREPGAAERAVIAAADLAFVASANPAGNLDVSHRGGRPGFVEWREERLWIPDYPGNSMFMTLGNLSVYPSAGLLFVDFAAGETLQLTGTAAIDLAVDELDGITGGSGRAWTLRPTAWRRTPLARGLRADVLDYSPFNP